LSRPFSKEDIPMVSKHRHTANSLMDTIIDTTSHPLGCLLIKITKDHRMCWQGCQKGAPVVGVGNGRATVTKWTVFPQKLKHKITM
jgi:hypothetical protein